MPEWKPVLSIEELEEMVADIEDQKEGFSQFPPGIMTHVYRISDTLREYLEIKEGIESGEIEGDYDVDGYGFRIRKH